MIATALLLDLVVPVRRGPAIHTRKWHYYNEWDARSAAWLRQLIELKQIPPGEVDERSICDVSPDDLAGFIQCHFFAGIGGWALALRRAGWPEDREAWSASLPCQPFSDAGKGLGEEDERHLFPVFHELAVARKPPVIIGEQVASKKGLNWYAGVRAQLEAASYDLGCLDISAAGSGPDCEIGVLRGDTLAVERGNLGPPHIRQRQYWIAVRNYRVADAERHAAKPRWTPEQSAKGAPEEGAGASVEPGRCSGAGRMVNVQQQGLEGHTGHVSNGRQSRRVDPLPERPASEAGGAGELADAGLLGDECGRGSGEASGVDWSDFHLIPCLDGKSRRAQPGIFPLAHGIPRGVVPSCDPRLPGYAQATGEGRMMRLFGYGNALCIETATEFVETCMEVIDG